MEFLRFGSRITGRSHGCCAIDIIQNFDIDPDSKGSSQIVHGDSGAAQTMDGQLLFAGPTYRDVFNTRLRIGTFSKGALPNHAFFAALTASQCKGVVGIKWLTILKENGFEFLRAVDNSVYSGNDAKSARRSRDPVYVFVLFRNVGGAALDDPHEPPETWTTLPECEKTQDELWEDGQTVLFTEPELHADGVPVWISGKKGDQPFIKNPSVPKEEPTESPLLQPLCAVGEDSPLHEDEDYPSPLVLACTTGSEG